MIMGWRVGLGVGVALLLGFALFSFLRYQDITTIANSSVSLSEQERPHMFPPALLDDIKAFWERRGNAY